MHHEFLILIYTCYGTALPNMDAFLCNVWDVGCVSVQELATLIAITTV